MLAKTACRCAAAFLVSAAFFSPVTAQEKEPEKQTLPLSKVVLFNSGVGFYEHQGAITGDAKVDFKFNVEDINDLLKSMVLEDSGGGRISTVTYGSKDPITKTLQTFAVDLTENPTLADLLKQVRGEKVQVEAAEKIVGVIVGVESRQIRVKEDQVVEQQFLILLADAGLLRIPLDSLSSISLLDEKLNRELQQALAVLALGHSTDKKTVTLNFLGDGERPVRVGYIQEAPIWKTSYRLVLRDKEAPFLQGWAIVENTTEEDWKEVDLTLVSGRPISFVMDLYQPLYVQRPVVQQELYASLRPQVYGQDMAEAEQEFAQAGQGAGGRGSVASRSRAKLRRAPSAPGEAAAEADMDYLVEESPSPAEDRPYDPQAGVQSVAQAGDVGELFRYAIGTPVTLPRQQSAMLPIVNDSVKGEKVSIYNPGVHPKHPLNGLKLSNSTGLHLMQGPVTVFDDGVYAGDARIEDLQPGTERLISYALDLDTEVAPERKSMPDQLVSVKIVKGVLYAKRKLMQEQKYTVKNSGQEAKQVLIEQGVQSAWTLVAPKDPAEKTRDLYRFAVKAEPGKPVELVVREERTIDQTAAVTNLDHEMVMIYVNSDVVSEEVKAALQEVTARKQALGQILAQRQELERQVQVVEQEQNRIRQNMQQLDRANELYKRYVKKFSEQEDQVEGLRQKIQLLIEEETKARQSLEQYVAGLELE